MRIVQAHHVNTVTNTTPRSKCQTVRRNHQIWVSVAETRIHRKCGSSVFGFVFPTMGNHHSHGGKGDATPPSRHSSNNSSKKAISRTASGADIQEKTTTQLLPVERLAKVRVIRMRLLFLWLLCVFESCVSIRREI